MCDGAAHRRVVFVPFQDIAEVADAGGRQRLDRPRRNRVDADILLAEIGGEIAHARLQRRLRHAHHVIMRHPFLGAVIGQRQDRAAVDQELLGALRDRGQRIAADQHGLGEIVRCGVDIAAVELVLVGKRDRVHHEIDLAPFLLHHIEGRVDGRRLGDVAMADHDAVEFLGQRLDPLLQRLALPGQGDFRAGGAAGLAMPQAIERLLATPRITPRLPCINPEVCAINFPIGYRRAPATFVWHRVLGASKQCARPAKLLLVIQFFREYDRDCGVIRVKGDAGRHAAWTKAAGNDHVRAEGRSHDSGTAPLCARAGARCRHRRRSGAGHAGAGVAFGAAVSRR